MNIANKITISRIYLSIIIMILLIFPFYEFKINFPTFLVNGNILVDTRYIIAGVLFIIASTTDFLDGYLARKYKIVSDYGKMLDAISDKILTNSLLIILAVNGMISLIIPVVIVVRDIVVDALKMFIGNRSSAVAAIPIAKVKTATLMVGLALTLFYNLPFELIGINISDFLLIIAAILSVISGIKYYNMAKQFMKESA